MGEASERKARLRRLRVEGESTRSAILRAAVSLASVDGLEGLSIGNLAAEVGMSKSGLYAHFGSKEELQLATVEEAARIFDDEVSRPALSAPAGAPQLEALMEAYFEHLERRALGGGCFFSSAAMEMGTRPGPVKEAVAAFGAGLNGLLHGFAASAIEQHQLPPDEDPEQLVFEFNGFILAASASFILSGDPAVLGLARQVVRRRLRRGR